MKKKPTTIHISPDVRDALDGIGERYSLTGNQVLAAAASELARIRPENLWHALGRIASEDGAPALSNPNVARIPRGSERTLQAI